MALSVGNKTAYHQIPASNSLTLSHTQNAGADRVIIVSMAHSNTVNINAVRYGGVLMTVRINRNLGGQGIRQSTFELKDPPSGSNNLVLNWSGSLWNFASIQVTSFLGADVGGNIINTGGSSSPNSRSITVSAGSVIYSRGVSPNSFTNITVAGRSSTGGGLEPNNKNINKITSGAYSNAGLTAGTYNVVHTTTSGGVSVMALEVKEGGTTPVTNNGNFFLTL